MNTKLNCSLAVAFCLFVGATSHAANTPSPEEMWQAIQKLQAENRRLRQLIVSSSLTSTPVRPSNDRPAQTSLKASDVSVSVGGFIRADAGHGDRYGDAHEDDRLAVSKAALAIVTQYQNIKGVFVVGTEISTINNLDEDGNVDIKDAFIVISDFGWDGFDLTVGAQPLLIGLKPEGYPGDHSIQGSIEYGAGGAFAVSNQAGPALVADWRYSDNMTIRVGMFDQKDYFNSGTIAASSATEGSDISDNYYVQWTGSNLFGSGAYANLVFESRYVGGTINDNEDIWAAGLGWKRNGFDLSLEYVSLDKVFNGTLDDESYYIAELSFPLGDNTQLYLDYSEADELDVTTYRVGVDYQYNPHTTFSIEYSDDDLDDDRFDLNGSPLEDIESVDLRVTLHY